MEDMENEMEMDFTDFVFEGAVKIAVKVREVLDSDQELSSQDLMNLSSTLLNVMDLLTGGEDGCGCEGHEDD